MSEEEEILGAFLLVNDYRILTNEELENVKKAIKNLQQENIQLKDKLNCLEIYKQDMPEDTEFVILTKSNYERQEKDIELEKYFKQKGYILSDIEITVYFFDNYFSKIELINLKTNNRVILEIKEKFEDEDELIKIIDKIIK